MIEAATLAAGHSRTAANIQRNLITELASRGALLLDDVDMFARLLGMEVEDLLRD